MVRAEGLFYKLSALVLYITAHADACQEQAAFAARLENVFIPLFRKASFIHDA
jgi:hypothetical protein